MIVYNNRIILWLGRIQRRPPGGGVELEVELEELGERHSRASRAELHGPERCLGRPESQQSSWLAEGPGEGEMIGKVGHCRI